MIKKIKKFLAQKLILWLSDYLPSCSIDVQNEPMYIVSSTQEHSLINLEDDEAIKRKLNDQYYEIMKQIPKYSKVVISKGDFNSVRISIKLKIANIRNK